MGMKMRGPSQHHCTSLDCLRALVEQLGYEMDKELSTEDEDNAVAASVQRTMSGLNCCRIELNKQTGVLTVRDRLLQH